MTVAAKSDVVPSFLLYGEAPGGDLPDVIHVEALRERSQRHGWEIKPHRHFGLLQIMHFQTSNVRVQLDGVIHQTDRPSILIIPPTVIHGFRFSPEVIGSVTTIPLELAQDTGRGASTIIDQTVLVDESHQYFAYFAQLLHHINHEYRAQHSGRDQALLALIQLMSLWIGRFQQDQSPPGAVDNCRSQAERRVRSFLALVEQHYVDGWGTSDYGYAIGISKSQLTRDCRAVLEKSPLQVVHERVIKEANRKLAYTPWPVATISDRLGFTDFGYFSRFYRQKTGETPSDYRTRVQNRQRSTQKQIPV